MVAVEAGRVGYLLLVFKIGQGSRGGQRRNTGEGRNKKEKRETCPGGGEYGEGRE